MFLLGTDNYFEIVDHANLDFSASENFTLMVAGRTYDVSPDEDHVLVFKKDNLTTSAGYGLYLESADDTAKFLIADGTLDDEDATPNLTAGNAFVVVGVKNETDDDIEAFLNGVGSGSPTTDSTTVGFANALPVRIGATSNTAANFADLEIHSVVKWREALSDTDVITAANELFGSSGGLLLLRVG